MAELDYRNGGRPMVSNRYTALDAMRDARAENIANGTPSLPSVTDATERQLEYIQTLLTKRVHPYPSDNLPDMLRVWCPKLPMTKAQASATITFLKAQPERTAPVPPVSSGSPARSDWAALRVLAEPLAGGRYAVTGEDGTTDFWYVSSSEWNGRTYIRVKPVVGGQGAVDSRMSCAAQTTVVNKIIAAGPREAMERYGKEIGRCGHCNRLLTDELSRSRGIGPVCWENM